MVYISKILAITLVLNLSDMSSVLAVESHSQTSARSNQSICDMTNPIKPLGCSVTDLNKMLVQKLAVYVAFGGEKVTRPTEEQSCVGSANKLWLTADYEFQHFDRWEPDRWHGPYPYLSAIVTKWAQKIEKNWSLNLLPQCLGWRSDIGLDWVSNPEEAYKARFRSEYWDIFARQRVALEANNTGKSWSEYKRVVQEGVSAEVISMFEIVGKQFVDDYFKLYSDIKTLAESTQVAAQQEKEKKELSDRVAEAKQKKNAAAERAVQEKKDAAADKAAIEKIKARGGCQIDKSNRRYSWYENGDWYNFPDGTRKCTNRKWGEPSKNSRSNGGSGNNSKNRSLVSKSCDLRAGALSSSWNGQSYSWTIWNNWSDGSKTIASAGSGYANSVPNGC
jgi:hypothetical protein